LSPTGPTKRDTRIFVPPADIRYRVASQNHSEEEYLQIGEASAYEIREALRGIGDDIGSFKRILDFGCGCSRVLQFLHRSTGQAELHGSDIDRVGIEWSRDNIDYAKFRVNSAMPPLAYESEYFNFIYALSVFSHLDAEMQREWFKELDRVLVPGGLLYFTFSGPFVFHKYKSYFDGGSLDEFEKTGFTFVRNISDKVLPDWYQTSLQNIDYLKTQFPLSFDLLEHVDRGHTGWQDRAVVRKVR
jgi:SAM-dependent methyltransferase